jgi:hypothetical protein
MKTRMKTPAARRRALRRWASFLGREYVGKKRAWKCTFCGVIGSHRRGCHYVTQEHHRDPKPVRRGILGVRGRAKRAKAFATK